MGGYSDTIIAVKYRDWQVNDESPGISAGEALSLEDEMTKLVLEGVTEESLAGIKSMFEDPEYILM